VGAQEDGGKRMSDHDELKQMARKILMDRGFKEAEIFEEYMVKTHEMRTGFRVDVAGITDDLKIAVECGAVQGQKVAQLQLFFDEVVLLPYLSCKKEIPQKEIPQDRSIDQSKAETKDEETIPVPVSLIHETISTLQRIQRECEALKSD
jgi:hypothetical protein